LQEADKIIYALIDERRKALSRETVVADLLHTAHVEDPAAMSRKALRDNIVTILLAGHETSASTLAWSFQALAHNPAALAHVNDEIDEDAGNTYLRATIYEVLRYRPVFLFTAPRVVKREIEIGGHTFMPPAYLFGAIFLVHHDPTFYPEPQAFLPERFVDFSPEAPLWIPWGGGRKRCPGLHLALMELEIVIRTVLSRVTIQVTKKMERAKLRSLIVAPADECQLVLHNRR
jgi:cytochrome P450